MTDYQVTKSKRGLAVGQPVAVDAAAKVLADGGNAVDAAVTAALVSAVVSLGQNGIGGYGGHMVVAMRVPDGISVERSALSVENRPSDSTLNAQRSTLPPSYTVSAIDFNSAAPAAAHGEMFADLWDGGAGDWMSRGGRNVHGPLAAGVPGTLAGLQKALDRFGTRTFAEAAAPAISHCLDGFPAPAELAATSQNPSASLQRFPETLALLRPQGRPIEAGELFRNPDLGRLLQTLAGRGRVDTFYDGDIGQRIAAAVQDAGGILTAADMAAYRAREVTPLAFAWRGMEIRTAPPTAGGLTELQALRALAALGWEQMDWQSPEATQVVLEAARAAWHDRLALLGDAEQANVPIERLLSEEYAERTAERVRSAVKTGRRLEGKSDGGTTGGTVHMSFADAAGNVVALTQTHGSGYGSQFTVGGLGLTLGHGMSRFNPRPGHPNSPGPGKRPLHNMCPSIVLRDGVPILTLGGAGGRRIVNAVMQALLHFVGRDAPIGEALNSPRFHTEGGDALWVDEQFPEPTREHLRRLGYVVQPGSVAIAHGIQIDPSTPELTGLTEPRKPERGTWGVAAAE